jgi:rhamnopyranosyl-N-acetylglucosaminyl-diphospho-decaprenol beta-1,3/1,4-galactofuranosyltransferase
VSAAFAEPASVLRAPKVVAVVVTYNRRELVLETLAALDAQTRKPDSVVVVDNASDDETGRAVRAQFPDVHLVELTRNTGGAGGFAHGIAVARSDSADLIWLMDDDTEPMPDALQALLASRDLLPGPSPALVASRVVWTDGRDHPMNTPRRKPLASPAEIRAAAAAGCIPIRSASFVSVLVDARECGSRGAPVADFFLWNDDFEFTTRLVRGNVGLLCRASVAVHKTRTFGSTDVDPGERFFYEVRNKIWTLTARSNLAPLERVLYSGSTLRRWGRTFANSTDRRTLRRAFVRGVLAGVGTRPRANSDVLAGAVPM